MGVFPNPNDTRLCSKCVCVCVCVCVYVCVFFIAKTGLLLKNLKFRQDSHITPDKIALIYYP